MGCFAKKKLSSFSLFFLVLIVGLLWNNRAIGQSVSFDQTALKFNSFSPISNGTSLKFGPDERLYVSQIDGTIKIYTILKVGTNQYEVIDAEVLTAVKEIPNFDDNGNPAFDNRNKRQITGLTVAGSAANPIIYVSSSDPKWGGPSGDKGLDTNSGTITRLTWTGSAWDVIDLVRGLPRSEENHSTNGLEHTLINGKPYLLVTSGGFTNAGAPSKNFTYITEYALGAAILSVDLDAIEALPTKIDPISGRQVKYDIPTLDDPSRPNKNFIYNPNHPSYNGIDENDPFGGNDGLNMAMVVAGGPVQIFSGGYRNSYDLVVTESNRVYATDNGANVNWGGLPENEGNSLLVSNNFPVGEPGGNANSPSASGEYVDNKDHLHLIARDLDSFIFGSYYGGHPTPVRANPGNPYSPGSSFPFNPSGAGLYTKFVGDDDNWSNIVPDFPPSDKFRTQILQPIAPGSPGFDNYAATSLPANWPPVPLSMANGKEADFIAPSLPNPNGPQTEIITQLPINSNGIDEYKASNFAGQLKGALVVGKSGGFLHLIHLNPDGLLNNLEIDKWNLNGGNALGVSCNADDQIFPGTIWVATYDNRIMVLTPTDQVVCIAENDPAFNTLADYDFDGYTNQDEIDNGSDYCSGASIPNDFDEDLVSDLNDTDDDGDDILDQLDPFQLGYSRNLPINNELFSNQLDAQGRQSGFLGLGLTGLMNNGALNPNWLNWLDKPNERPGPADIYGGAAGAIQVSMTAGSANGTANNQEKGFQFGVNVGLETGIFTISSGLLGLTSPGALYEYAGAGEVGIQMGDGSQSNFIKLVFTSTHLVAAQEINDVPDPNPIMISIPVQDRPDAGVSITLGFDVDPSDGSVKPFYKFGNGDKTQIGSILSSGAVKTAIQNIDRPLAIGIFGTSNDTEGAFIGVWDYFRVAGNQPYTTRDLGNVEKIINDPDLLINLNEYFDDNGGNQHLTYSVVSNTFPQVGAKISGSILTLSFPNNEGQSEITIRATDKDNLFVEQSFLVNVNVGTKVFLRINAGGGTLNDASENPDWLSNSIAGAVNTEAYNVNAGNLSNNTFVLAKRHASIPSYISDEMYLQIFNTERYNPGSSMQFNIPIPNGDYLVNLYMGNGYEGTSAPGQRVFSVAIEGEVQLPEVDLSAQYGHNVGAMVQIPITLDDEELNINFIKNIENPLINGIEIIRKFGSFIHNPIVVVPPDNLINSAGEELDGSLFIEATGGDGNLNYAASGLPPSITIEPTNGTIYGTLDVDAHVNSPYQVTVTVDDEDGTSSDAVEVNFTWTVSSSLLQQTWKIKNESQQYTGRHENSFVQAGNKFYLLGGRENSKTVEIYDYTNDSWTSLPNTIPFEFNHFQAVEYQGLIWVIGAFKSNNFPNEIPADHIWIFNPASQEWMQGAEIPQGRKRGSAGVVVYNGKFYVVNGNTQGHSGGAVNYFDEFDPQTGEWTVLENSPQARDHFFSTVVGKEMYVISGRRSGGDGGVFNPVIPEVDVYNFSTQTWKTLPAEQNLPTPRAGAITNNYLDKIIVAGGEVGEQSQALAITEMYDPVEESWFLLEPLNFPRHGTQGIVSGKGLYVLAGSPTRGGGSQKNMEVFGYDQPKGTALIASELTVDDLLTLNSGETKGARLGVANGNTGIFIRSITINGPDASSFVIKSQQINKFLIRKDSQFDVEIEYVGTGLKEAVLEVKYGIDQTKTVQLKGQNAAPIVNLTASPISGFAPLQVDFSSAGSMGTGSLSFLWDFKDGITSTNADVNHTFVNPGSYNISLTVTDENGESAIGNVGITVNNYVEPSGPVSLPTASVSSGKAPLSVSFTGSGSTGSGPLSYLWDFGDGSSSTLADPLHTFTTAGVYAVKLKVTDGNGKASEDMVEVTVNPPVIIPEVSLYLNSGTVNDASLGGNIFVGDGKFSSYFGASNTYSNSLASSVPLYQTERFSKTLTYSIPVPNGVYQVSTYHNELYFGTSRGPAAKAGQRVYSIFLEGELVRANFDLFVANNNKETVLVFEQITVTDGVLNISMAASVNNAQVCGISVVSEQLSEPNPESIAVASVNSGTAPLSVNFTGSGSTGSGTLSYLWDFGDGSSSTLADPVHTFTTAGVYAVKLKVTDGNGKASEDMVEVTVNPPVVNPEISLYLNSGTVNDASLGGNTFVGDGKFSSYFGASNTYANSLASSVPLYQTERWAKTLTYSIPVPNGVYQVSTYHNELYFGTSSGPAAQAGQRVYSISLEGQLVRANFDLFVANNNKETVLVFEQITVTDGVLNISMAASANNAQVCGISVVSEQLSEPNPESIAVASVNSGTAPLSVNFTGSGSTGSGPLSYLWDFGDGSSSTLADPVHTFTTAGVYAVKLKVTDGNGKASEDMVEVTVNPPVIIPDVSLYLNSGTVNDASFGGNTFLGDGKFSSYFGASNTYTNSLASSVPLYQTERFSKTLTYSIPVPNGVYQVSTYHNELYFGTSRGPAAKAGQRVYSISLEGQLVRANFDLFVANNNKETVLVFEQVTVTDGVLNISMAASVNNAQVCGIRVISSDKVSQNISNLRVLSQEELDLELMEETNDSGSDFILLYPNPASDYITIELGVDIPLYGIYIYDMAGRMVVERDTRLDEKSTFTIPVGSLSKGVYMVTLIGENGIIKQFRLILKS
ncbi:PKD domain-containing protein [Cyclobacterium plantarum]|uniref:PKD domain-containing protein n=1 Tax=Cyclobacterium plantarum TaxID=2716263 RepID=A0ABX0HCN6_9BACT|nr:PKD domain-containing protein [Cyclobacterium plantarum]NHE59654.1 PKD domain-containing protein [Cyclobacterium plantarum]